MYHAIQNGNTSRPEETTCSRDVLPLGGGQRVLAFTYYGGDTFDTFSRDYFAGVRANLEALKQFYPEDFRMRLYYQIPRESPQFRDVCAMACVESRLDICDVKANPKFGDIR